VRTQLQRALTRLRRRLDEERGGRAAWMAALVPLAGARRSGPTALMVGLGLVGLASFGLVALAPNGCTADLATTAAPASDLALRETPADAAVPASPRAEWSAVAPKAAPLAPKKGKAPAKAEAEAEGLAHPKIVFFGAFREVFTSLEECREGDGVASVRFEVEAVFDGEDPPFVEVVHFEEPNNVADSEIECLRQTLLAMDMVAPSPAFGPFRYNPTAVFHFDAEGKLRSEGINRGPTMHLFTATKTGADLTEAVAACSSTEAAVELELTFDPGTYALTAIVPTDETDVAKCVQNAVRELVRPTRRFEPIHPEDATLRCAFWVGKPSDYKCRRTGPDGNYVQDL
jgi:hypothetical protein